MIQLTKKKEEMMKNIAEKLIKWYEENKRELPWRSDPTPYHVWVSEIMLQQTRIEAVKKYYVTFMKELPTIESLAKVEEEKLLKLWEGLGYYSRARNLKKAAMLVQEKYKGKMPSSYQELLQLPGVGEYTAGAIASICFEEQVPAIDGNVLRVVARLTANSQDILLPQVKKQITNQVKQILPKQAGKFNQAMMELGETICIPKGNMKCNECPIKEDCQAYSKQLTNVIPFRNPKVKKKTEEKTVCLLYYQNEIAIRKREEKGLLQQMYEFPNIPQLESIASIEEQIQSWGLQLQNIHEIGKVSHVFTHRIWNMDCYIVKVKNKNAEFIWVNEQELMHKYALPTAFSKILQRKEEKNLCVIQKVYK